MFTPDLITPVLGFRSWRVDPYKLSLMSQSSAYSNWNPGWNKSICRPGDYKFISVRKKQIVHPHEEAPHPDCSSCGFYAYHSTENVVGSDPLSILSRTVMGAIIAKGNLAVHKDGFRAEYARVVVLVNSMVLSHPGLIREIAEKYESIVIDSLEDLCDAGQNYGDIIPESLRPISNESQ